MFSPQGYTTREQLGLPEPNAISLESILFCSGDFARSWIKALVFQATSNKSINQEAW